MRLSSLPRPVFAVAVFALPVAAQAAFVGDFAITDATNPAGFHTVLSFDEEIDAALGVWAVGLFPSAGGASFIDTTHAPASVTLGAATPAMDDFVMGETLMIVEIPEEGFVSFSIQVCNEVAGNGYAGLEIYLSGEALYALTEPGVSTYELGFHVASGETLEFRAVSLSSGVEAHASNLATISEFLFVASAIPEPAAFGALIGVAALGLAGRRRRPGAALA